MALANAPIDARVAVDGRETIILVAHERCCVQLVDLAICYRDVLCAHRLAGSPTTASVLRDMAGLHVAALGSRGVALGQDLLSVIAATDVAAVILLDDGFGIANEPDVDFRVLISACNIRNVPLATNIATASAVLNALSVLRAGVAAGQR